MTLCGYLLHCPHGNEHTRTHDVIHDTFANIARDVGFHMGQEQLHEFFSTTFNLSYRQVDIVLTKDSILTLVEIVIIDPMRVDLLPDLAQLKDFPPLMQLKLGKGVITTNTPLIIIIKVFGCLYKHANVFLHDYANAIWNLKGPEGVLTFPF